MDIDAYLARIGLHRRPEPTLAGLKTLHRAHLAAVPYENFDVQLGNPVTTAIPAIYDKIVRRRRGGWCYEMNGIFGWALGELGFDVHRATGAVMRVANGAAVEGNHLVLRVDLPEGPHLADVGFGDGPAEPFAIAEAEITTSGFRYTIERLDQDWWRLNSFTGSGAPSYDFNPAPADEAHLSRMCEGLQTMPQSPFVQNAFAFRHTPEGIRVLRGRTLLHVRPGQITDRLVEDADDLVATLKDIFALDLPDAATAWPKIAARHETILAEKTASAG